MTSREFREQARHALTGLWGRALLVSLLATLLGADVAVSGFGGGNTASTQGGYGEMAGNIMEMPAFRLFFLLLVGFAAVATIWLLIAFIIGGAVELGKNIFFIGLAQGKDMQVSDLFSRFHVFGKALGLRIVMGLFITLWSLLFIIPGIIASYRYAMAPYIMAENPDVGIMEALEWSKQMMTGNKFRLFCLQFSFFGWLVVCGLTMGIALLWVRPYMETAIALFYLEVSGQGISGQYDNSETYGYTQY